MEWPDEKIVAVLALSVIALSVVFWTKNSGLDTVTNIVCAIGGLVTGNAMGKS